MIDETRDDEPPIPCGPFFSNYGPCDGLILRDDAPVMGVLDGQGAVVGIAWLAGSIPSKRGPAQLWRLTIGKVELEGRWICRCREFIRLGVGRGAIRIDQVDVETGALPPSVAYEVARLEDPEQQREVAALAVQDGLSRAEVSSTCDASPRRPRRAGGQPRPVGSRRCWRWLGKWSGR